MKREELLKLRDETDAAIEDARRAAEEAQLVVQRFDRARQAQPLAQVHVDAWQRGGCALCGAPEREDQDYAHRGCMDLASRATQLEILSVCFARDLYDARLSDLAVANLRRMTARDIEGLDAAAKMMLFSIYPTTESAVRENSVALVRQAAEVSTPEDLLALNQALERNDLKEVTRHAAKLLGSQKGPALVREAN